MTVRLRAIGRWMRDLLLFAPTHTRQSRLSRVILHEVTIYLSTDHTVYVHHLNLEGGPPRPDVAIRMCWEAMQHLAMACGVGITLPAQAAVPAQLTPISTAEPAVPTPAEMAAGNGHA
jgi:hypothetical protein